MTQDEALSIMKMGYNIFLTGFPGTGKTHVLRSYIEYLQKKHVTVGITASTGIAATHIDGVTVDSWSGIGIRDMLTQEDLTAMREKHHLYTRIFRAKVLIIDEISMISANRLTLLDEVTRYIRKSSKPLGGLQVVFSGDLFQLPPVSRDRSTVDFIFHSPVWEKLDLKICYLTQSYRHTESGLKNILTSIRQSQVSQGTIDVLNERLAKKPHRFLTPARLYTHNVDVDQINQKELSLLPDEIHEYRMTSLGNDVLIQNMKRACLAPEILQLKKGAQVMFVRNNYELGYVNGTMGKVVSFTENDDPIVELESRKQVTVSLAHWTIMEDEKIIAQLTQIPLRLAWAITVHKSQGMTLDSAIIDLSKSFIQGMGYVALSRVKDLDGLFLEGFNQLSLEVNPEIAQIDGYLQEMSQRIAHDLLKMNVLKKWMKKRKFMYTITKDYAYAKKHVSHKRRS